MQTWLIWNMLGLYPITATPNFLITSPWFESITIDLSPSGSSASNRKTLTITSTGGDGNGDSNYYVQSLKVNGVDWNKNWVVWSDIFEEGGSMEFVLGSEPSGWDENGERVPSPASETAAGTSRFRREI